MTQFFSYGFLGSVLFILFGVCMFFIIREITLWYFKINENTNSLRRIAESLEEISATLAADEVVTEETIIDDENNK